MGLITRNFIDVIERRSAHHYRRFPDLVAHSAEGVWIVDVEGNTYLDMFGAYSALALGHNHPEIKAVMMQNVPVVPHPCYTVQEAQFLESLCRVAGMEAALLINSGVEAVETAIKLARKWARGRKQISLDEAPEIIVAENAFHGRTLGALSAMTNPAYRDGFGPFLPGFIAVPFGDIGALKRVITPRTAAVLLEPIQCEAGIIIPPKGYLARVKELCEKHNVLFMLDEVQTGFGRTGTMFCFQHENARPDVLIIGKALGGGQYPVSAIAASREIMNTFKQGDHGSTFGGNALACALGAQTIEIFERDELVERSSRLGAYLLCELRKIQSPAIKEVRGRGLVLGIELAEDTRDAFDWCRALLACGVLCGTAHERVIRLSPPLIITKEQIDYFLLAFLGVEAALATH